MTSIFLCFKYPNNPFIFQCPTALIAGKEGQSLAGESNPPLNLVSNGRHNLSSLAKLLDLKIHSAMDLILQRKFLCGGVELLHPFQNPPVVQIVKQAGMALAPIELGGFFAPLCFPFSLFLEDRRRRRRRSLSGGAADPAVLTAKGAKGRRTEARTALAASKHGIIGNGQCQPALSPLSITATPHFVFKKSRMFRKSVMAKVLHHLAIARPTYISIVVAVPPFPLPYSTDHG